MTLYLIIGSFIGGVALIAAAFFYGVSHGKKIILNEILNRSRKKSKELKTLENEIKKMPKSKRDELFDSWVRPI